MSANRDLVIPSALNADAAVRQPHQLGGQNQQCDPNQEAGKEIDRAPNSTKDLDNLTELVRTQNSLQGIQSLASMVSERFGSTADYLKQVASEFSSLRETLPQVVKLTGWPGSTPCAPQQTPALGRAGLKLEDWVHLREEFTARAGARLEVNQRRVNTQQSGQFQQEIAEFTRSREISKLDATALASGLLRPFSVPQDLSRLLDPYVEVLKSPDGAATPANQILPQMNRLMSQATFPEEAKKLLNHLPKAIPSGEGNSIVDVIRARTSPQVTGRREAASLNEGMTPTHSIESTSPRLQDGVTNGDYLDPILKEFASIIREVRGLRGFVDRNVNASGFEGVSDYALETPADPLQQAIVDYRNSQAGEQTRLIAGKPPGRSEWVPVNAKLEQLRQQAKAKLGRESGLERPPLSYTERNTPSAMTETRAWEPVANERGTNPVWQMSSLLQSRSFTPGAASPMFDYEIRRILEQGRRLTEEAVKPGPTRLLVSPLPSPRTRM
jgi:hypothetical protein